MYIKVEARIGKNSTLTSVLVFFFFYRALCALKVWNTINKDQTNQRKLFHQAVCCDNDAIWLRQSSSVNPLLPLDQIGALNG